MHTIEPDDENFPGRQATHKVDALISASTVPAAQSIQFATPVVLYLPGPHIVQGVPGFWSESAKPGRHDKHDKDPADEYLPLAHTIHVVLGLESWSIVPAPQATQPYTAENVVPGIQDPPEHGVAGFISVSAKPL